MGMFGRRGRTTFCTKARGAHTADRSDLESCRLTCKVVQEQFHQALLGVSRRAQMEGNSCQRAEWQELVLSMCSQHLEDGNRDPDIMVATFCPAKCATCCPRFLGGLQLDGYCPDLSPAFDYEVEQQYDPDNYFHFGDRSSFEAQLERDARKLKFSMAEIINSRCLAMLHRQRLSLHDHHFIHGSGDKVHWTCSEGRYRTRRAQIEGCHTSDAGESRGIPGASATPTTGKAQCWGW